MVSASTIFYAIYFIYMFSLFIDWDFINTSECVFWTGIVAIFGSIFIIFLELSLNIEGHDLTGLSGTCLIMLLVVLLAAFGILLYSQHYTMNKLKTSIITKLQRRQFIPLNYQYGLDSQDIGLKLRITEYDIVPRDESRSLQEIWAQLMTRDSSQAKISRIMKQVLETDLTDSLDVSYNLLWYLCLSEEPFRTGLNRKERAYIVAADTTELREILGDDYIGAQDRASLIFAILSGQTIPHVPLSSRYEEVKHYNPRIVYNLAFIHNQMIDHTNGVYTVQGPYTFLSLQPASLIETIIANVDIECRSFRENYDALVERLGIGPVNNVETMNEDERIMHLQGELSLYHNVFTRDSETSPPPPLVSMDRHQIMDTLSAYTNVELIQTYEPRGKWASRSELMGLICDDVLNGPRWSIHSVLNCNNDNTININTIERHGDSDKYDPQDPTLSYGVHKNYRCFQASELTDSFTNYDGIFLFRIPDWTPGAIDPITGEPLIREFPLDSIKQLKVVLEQEGYSYNLTELLAKVQIGLDHMKSAEMQIRHMKQTLEQFTFEQRQIADLYMAWMFTYAMWMRFWKGPGHLWPLVKVNVTRETERARAQRSSPQERDEHVFIQESVRTAIIEMYESDSHLREWIEALPTIYYDFETTEASCAAHTIKSILDQIAIGEYCMGFGSDTILKTAYYYITMLLDYPQGPALDEFIERMFPQLQDLEYIAVTNQIITIRNPGLRLQILNDRLRVLQKPIPKQPSFNPSSYQNNVHVE